MPGALLSIATTQQPLAAQVVSSLLPRFVSDVAWLLAQRVHDILQGCEDKARHARMKEAAVSRQASWEAAKKSARVPHSARF
jgi:hypothetical protein